MKSSPFLKSLSFVRNLPFHHYNESGESTFALGMDIDAQERMAAVVYAYEGLESANDQGIASDLNRLCEFLQGKALTEVLEAKSHPNFASARTWAWATKLWREYTGLNEAMDWKSKHALNPLDPVGCFCYGLALDDFSKMQQKVVSFQEMQTHTGVGTRCGSCHIEAQELVRWQWAKDFDSLEDWIKKTSDKKLCKCLQVSYQKFWEGLLEVPLNRYPLMRSLCKRCPGISQNVEKNESASFFREDKSWMQWGRSFQKWIDEQKVAWRISSVRKGQVFVRRIGAASSEEKNNIELFYGVFGAEWEPFLKYFHFQSLRGKY